MLPGFSGLSLALLHRRAVQLIRSTPHSDLTQGGQILCGKKMLERLLRLPLPVHFSRLKAFYKLIRFNIHQFNLIGPVKYMIRDSLIDRNACDGRYQIVERLQMLHIHRGIDVDPSLEQFFHILIPLCVPASFGIIMGQFVYQNELWFSLQRSVQVKLFQLDSVIVNTFAGQDLQPIQQRQCIWSGMRLYIAHYNIYAFFLRLMGRLQHGIGLAHTRRIAKKDFQLSGKEHTFRVGLGTWPRLLQLLHEYLLL